jgi:hypothetical protein
LREMDPGSLRNCALGMALKKGTAMGQDRSSSTKGDRSAEREARLSEALRENLKKRKHQARARKDKDGDGKPDAGEA